MRYLVKNAEGFALVLILFVVAAMAGAASFTHVHDWTMANSPADTPGWFGWANAVISELVPVACALVIRRRRRAGESVGYPFVVLVGAVLLSLAAQLAVAKPGFSGGLLSSVPAIAFMALVKLVLSTKPPKAPAESPSVTEPAVTPEPTPVQQRVDQVPVLDALPALPDLPDLPSVPDLPSFPEPLTVRRVNGAIPSGVVR